MRQFKCRSRCWERKSTAKPIRLFCAAFLVTGILTTASAGDDPRPAVEGSSAFGIDASARLVETGFGPAPFYTLKDDGADFVTAGTTTRSSTGIAEPFVLVMPAIPGAEVASFIQWNWLLNGAAPLTDTITINGVVITGTQCGTGTPDLCWDKAGAVAYMAPLPAGVVIAPGGNIIGGATDRAVGADPLALGEGLSILTVYRVAGAATRNVDLYCGYTSNISSVPFGTATAVYAFSNPYVGGGAHFFLNGLDTQNPVPGWEDSFFINGIAAGGAVAGTFPNTNAWQGLLGPLGINNLYDHADGPLGAPYLAPGDVVLTATTTLGPLGSGDCIGHSFGGISFGIKVVFPKWSQLPKDFFEGFNVPSNVDWLLLSQAPPGDPGPGPNIVVADDFQSDGRPITYVRFWGSYIDPAFEPTTIPVPNLSLGSRGIGPPIGACCLPDGTCIETDPNNCFAGGGTYLGDGTLCIPNPCDVNCFPDPTGTLCVGDCPPGFNCAPRCIEYDPLDPNNFQILDCVCVQPDECQIEIIPGVGFNCIGNCPPGFVCERTETTDPLTGFITLCCDCVPIGGCCLPSGLCIDTTATTCANSGGTYLGDGVSCGPTGACCFADGTCIVLTDMCCVVQGGVYQGDGVSCNNPNPCVEPPFGACCLSDGTCLIINGTQCQAQGGIYQGDNTFCTPNSCFGDGTEIDGWLISFHTDLPANQNPDGFSKPDQLLALYFAPANAVSILPTGIFGCDNHRVYEYLVELEDTCLLHSYQDTRPGANPPLPGLPNAFLETAGFIYWIDIQAVVGHTVNTHGVCFNCNCDINNDGFCDILDLLFIFTCFDAPPIGACARADINCDGFIDNLDVQAWQCLAKGNSSVVCCDIAGGGVCVEMPTENFAIQDFWGWHTSRDNWNDNSTWGPLVMGPPPDMDWLYPDWTPVPVLCGLNKRVDQAFELLTPDPVPPCPTCPDITDAKGVGPDGQVNVFDLLALLAAWGPCPVPCPPFCPADVNCDCAVNVFDLLDVLSAWGPCPP